MSTYGEKIKAKIKEADLETQLSGLVDEGEKLLKNGVAQAGDLAHDKRDDVETWLEKTRTQINEKTEGKYADNLSKLSTALLGGLDKIASKRTGGSEETDGVAVDPLALEAPGDAEGQPKEGGSAQG